MKARTLPNGAHVEEIDPHAMQDVELLQELARSGGEVPVVYRITKGNQRVEFVWFYALGSVGIGTETTRFAGHGGVIWIEVARFGRSADARAALGEVVSHVLDASARERIAIAQTLEYRGERRFATPVPEGVPDAEAFAHEWRRVGMPGEPTEEPDGTVFVAVESWDLRVFYHPRAAALVLRRLPDAKDATESDQFKIGNVLEESLTRPVARAEALHAPPRAAASTTTKPFPAQGSTKMATHPLCAGGCGKTVQRGGVIRGLDDGSSETYHIQCFDRRESAHARKPKAPRTATGFQIRMVDENAWKATVFHRGAMYVCDYAPMDEKDGGDPETGAPTEARVREDWKDRRSAFRRV